MAKRQNGKESLRKRGDGRWEGRFNVGVNENGKPKVKYILAKTQAECAHNLKAAIEEYEHDKEITERCTFLTNPNPTLSEWSAIWLSSYCKGIVCESTYENYAYFFERYINPGIGEMEIRNISTIIRTISISDECLKLLKGLKAKQPVGTKLMFPSPVTGTYYDPKSITYRLHRIQRRAGVPQIRFHDLRHPYVKLKTKKFRDFWSKKPTFRITLSSAFVFAPSETNRARENLLLHSLFQFDCP